MSNSEVSPKAIEQLDSLKPHRTYPWNPSSDAGSSSRWEFSVGELYGCICHRPLDEPAPSPIGSHPARSL
jgi:hypothetical protein